MVEGSRDIKSEIFGIISLILALFIGISLATYNKWDPSFFTYTTSAPKNYAGIAGSYVSDLAVSVFGTTALFVPFMLLFYCIKRIFGLGKRRHHLFSSFLLLVSASMLVSLFVSTFDMSFLKGGLVGDVLTYVLRTVFSIVGAFIISLSLFYSSIIMLAPLRFVSKAIKKEDIVSERPEELQLRIIETIPRDVPDDEETLVTNTETSIRMESALRRSEAVVPELREGQYVMPTEALLEGDSSDRHSISKEELFRAAAILIEKLSDFGVIGKIEQVHPGPVISMFEFEPAPGVKISKVVSLSDDLGRAMGGSKVRVSLIPGKTTIGIEVPNEDRSIVTLKEIIASDKFKKRKSLLTLCLGKDIYGTPVADDLARMPHLLVAGTTGSGKSVAVNSMIMSILFKAKPSEVKMLMVDPKLLELSIYDGIPHLLAPVITDPKEASDALKKMLLEMERRYRLIAEQGVRNIEMFNASVSQEDKLPFIVVIIDELADLMFTSSKNVENSIVRLAQMARASGIHLIIATQRPSVDVITGIIKANFPSRIAFQVSSRVDSRTILDTHGAEKLLGRGDMLVLSPGARIVRVHGAYVTENEIRAVTDFIKNQGKPDYTFFDSLVTGESQAEGSDEQRDELYKDVIDYARAIGEISVSSIQRRFKIGYNRAARIMDTMDTDGLVGPPKGAGKPRDFVQN